MAALKAGWEIKKLGELCEIELGKTPARADLSFWDQNRCKKEPGSFLPDFFAGRWNRVTDRQRELLSVVAQLPNCDDEFTVQEVVEQSRNGSKKPFSPSHVNQILAKLADNGLVYKNRHGRYLFAVPLLGGFIRRQEAPEGV